MTAPTLIDRLSRPAAGWWAAVLVAAGLFAGTAGCGLLGTDGDTSREGSGGGGDDQRARVQHVGGRTLA